MKKLIFLILVFHTFLSLAQKNEFLALPGITTYHFYIDQSAVFQYKYERAIGNMISVQTGIRYHNEIEQKSYDGISKWIQYSFNSYKLDATFLLIPVNQERFKLKAGMGFDIGLSNYFWSARGVTLSEQTFEGDGNLTYWQYDIDRIADIGMHFVFQGNYYFKNNLFIVLQILYNYTFDDEVADPKYSKTLYRSSPICLSAGLGYRF